jgi:hypothetical protein
MELGLIRQEMGIEIVRIPRSVHGYKEGETPLFGTESVEWAMGRVRSLSG